MKNIRCRVMVLAVSCSARADVAIITGNFPDETFRNYVRNTFDKSPKDGSLSDAEIAAATKIDVFYNKNISSLKGIEYFTALENLECSLTQLTTLDVSKNTALERLSCSVNQLTALDVRKDTALVSLICNNNQLAALDVSKNTALGR